MSSINPRELLQLMAARRSVRDYLPRPVPRATVMALIDAAVTAPSASNKQPWRFYVVDDAATLASMARDVEARLQELLSHLPAAVHAQVHDYGRYFVRFAAAPVVVAVAYRPLAVLSHLLADAPDAPAELVASIVGMEHHSSVVSASLAVQNLMLQAHASGLGSSCLAGPLIAADALARACGVPTGWNLACMVALGHAADQPISPGRKEAAAVVRWVSNDRAVNDDAMNDDAIHDLRDEFTDNEPSAAP